MTGVDTAVGESFRVSVIVPVYNGERYLREAIDSVLAQTYSNYEIIVIDDGSTDGSSSILELYGSVIQNRYQLNQGTASARNAGVRCSSGEFLAFLDQDDLWAPDKLERQMALMKESAETEIVWGDVQQFVSPELLRSFKKQIRISDTPVLGFLPSALLVRRRTFIQVGYFDEKWEIGEWADWYARQARLDLNENFVSKVVAYRRIHESNKGILMANLRSEYLGILRENIRKLKENSNELIRGR